MTREEFSILIKGLKAVYADPKFIPDKDAFDVWYLMIGDLDYKTASLAIQKHIMTETRYPAIADIRRLCLEISKPKQITEMEAWSMVSKAIRDSAYHAQERFDEFPEAVKRAVGSPDNLRAWGMSEDYNENVAQSHFLSTYKIECEREKKYDALPVNMQNTLTQIALGTQALLGDKE